MYITLHDWGEGIKKMKEEYDNSEIVVLLLKICGLVAGATSIIIGLYLDNAYNGNLTIIGGIVIGVILVISFYGKAENLKASIDIKENTETIIRLIREINKH